MNNLIPFTYNSKQVRAISKDGVPWFILQDVCKALEIANVGNVTARLDVDEKDIHYADTPGGKQMMVIVNEPGLYNVILRSDKPEAKAFKRWITHEVIPSIRKHGAYTLQKPQCIEDLIIMQATAMKELRTEVKQLQTTQQAIKDAVVSEPDNWREDINHKLNKIAQALGSQKYQEIRTESYRLLEQRAHVDLERRLNNYRGNLINAGASQTAIKKANKLDIIEQDPKLREIYSKIVSEYLIKYVA
jgi:prophage antirepressor-like protein